MQYPLFPYPSPAVSVSVCVRQKRQMCQSVCQAAWPMRQQEVEGIGEGEAEISGQKENGQNDLLDDATNGYTSEQQNAANGQRAI